MFNFIKNLFAEKQTDKIPTRLSDSQAIAIACATDIAADHKDQMTLTTVILRDGKPAWVVTSATLGSMIEVVIDDETGDVIKAGRIGVR